MSRSLCSLSVLLAAWPLQDFHNTQAASIKALINLIIAIGKVPARG